MMESSLSVTGPIVENNKVNASDPDGIDGVEVELLQDGAASLESPSSFRELLGTPLLYDICQGIGKQCLIIDGDSVVRHALLFAGDHSTLSVIYRVEQLLHRFIERTCSIRVLFPLHARSPRLFRDIIRLHLLIRTDVQVDDAVFARNSQAGASASWGILPVAQKSAVLHYFDDSWRQYCRRHNPSGILFYVAGEDEDARPESVDSTVRSLDLVQVLITACKIYLPVMLLGGPRSISWTTGGAHAFVWWPMRQATKSLADKAWTDMYRAAEERLLSSAVATNECRPVLGTKLTAETIWGHDDLSISLSMSALQQFMETGAVGSRDERSSFASIYLLHLALKSVLPLQMRSFAAEIDQLAWSAQQHIFVFLQILHGCILTWADIYALGDDTWRGASLNLCDLYDRRLLILVASLAQCHCSNSEWAIEVAREIAADNEDLVAGAVHLYQSASDRLSLPRPAFQPCEANEKVLANIKAAVARRTQILDPAHIKLAPVNYGAGFFKDVLDPSAAIDYRKFEDPSWSESSDWPFHDVYHYHHPIQLFVEPPDIFNGDQDQTAGQHVIRGPPSVRHAARQFAYMNRDLQQLVRSLAGGVVHPMTVVVGGRGGVTMSNSIKADIIIFKNMVEKMHDQVTEANMAWRAMKVSVKEMIKKNQFGEASSRIEQLASTVEPIEDTGKLQDLRNRVAAIPILVVRREVDEQLATYDACMSDLKVMALKLSMMEFTVRNIKWQANHANPTDEPAIAGALCKCIFSILHQYWPRVVSGPASGPDSVVAEQNLLGSAEFRKQAKTVTKSLAALNCAPKVVEACETQLGRAVRDLRSQQRCASSFARFQLECMAPLLPRVNGVADPRVTGYKLDVWQKELLDIVDRDESAVIVAPTSAGKTFICFYAMELALRANDSDIVVYVSPTKALVQQTAAEIHFRFQKEYRDTSRKLMGVFTRDIEYDSTDCQVLVTVPQCLEILLLSAVSYQWASKIKRVIFDEVHNMLGNEGAVWERLLCMVNAPILALSATVAEPELIHAWLSAVEAKRTGTARAQPALVQHTERYNDLALKLWVPDKHSPYLSQINPVALLDPSSVSTPGTVRELQILPEQCGPLYDALLAEINALGITAHGPVHELCVKIRELAPELRFPEPSIISFRDAHVYGSELLQCLEECSRVSMSVTEKVIDKLGMQVREGLVCSDKEIAGGQRKFLLNNVAKLAKYLRGCGGLPAIIFRLKKRDCTEIAHRLCAHLFEEEEGYRHSPPFEREMHRLKQQADDAGHRLSELARKFIRLSIEQEQEQEAAKRTITEYAAARNETVLPGYCYGLVPEVSDLADLLRITPEQFMEEEQNEIRRYRDWCRSREGSEPLFLYHQLRRGIGVHHAGLTACVRKTVESLFRWKRIQILISTSALAVGINMPARTVVFAGDSPYLDSLSFRQMAGRAGRRGFDNRGDVIFFGLPGAKLMHLISGSLPQTAPKVCISPSILMRFIVQYDGWKDTPSRGLAIGSAKRVIEDNLLTYMYPAVASQVHFIVGYSVELLRQLTVMTEASEPQGLAGIVSHLHYEEPGNLAFVHLLASGIIGRALESENQGYTDLTYSADGAEDRKKFVLLHLCAFLFGRVRVPRNFTAEECRHTTNTPAFYLEDLPVELQQGIKAYNEHVLNRFVNYLQAYVLTRAVEDACPAALPLSKMRYQHDLSHIFRNKAPSKYATPYITVSPFVALEGRTDADSFRSVSDLADSMHDGIRVDPRVIPALDGLDMGQNRYMINFYMQPNIRKIEEVNGIIDEDLYTVVMQDKYTMSTIAAALRLWGREPVIANLMESLASSFSKKVASVFAMG